MDLSIDSDLFYSLDSIDNLSDASSDCVHLSDLLHNTFSPFPKNLNLCHINAQSIPSHYSELLSTFISNCIHACLVSESFLKPSLPTTSFSLPGYILIRNDRIDKGCGGVAIYLRADIKYKILATSSPHYNKGMEYIVLELNFNTVKFMLGVVYAPPNSDYLDALELLLATHLPEYEHAVLMGDFNTCLLQDSARSRKFLTLTSSLNLHIPKLDPTHHVNDSHSLIDHILTSSSERIATHGQFTASGFSHHDLIFASYKLRIPKLKPKIIFQRNFASMDHERLADDAASTDWIQIERIDNIDDKVKCFNSLVTDLLDRHAPLHPVRMKRPPAPWLTPAIRKQMAYRDALRRKHKKDPSEANWNNFKFVRNRCNQMIRNAKRRHIHSSVENCSSKNLWQFLHSLGLGRCRKDQPLSVDKDGLNRHFSSPPHILDPVTKALTISNIQALPIAASSPLHFTPVTETDIKKIILSIPSKAVGSDGIGRDMLLPILPFILSSITSIINFSLSSGTFPTLWKLAFMVPVPKISSPVEFKHYRPISILPFLSKVLERVVLRQFSNFLSSNNLLNPLQSGFRPSHSTCSALIKITDDLRKAVDDSQLTLLTLLDFSNAFNCVDHDILLSILRSLNMSGSVTEWFSSYLSGRRQRIRSDDIESDWCDVTAGVPQGGVLSPILFSVFINTLVSVLKFTSYHLYADDLQLYVSCGPGDVLEAIDKMTADLDAVKNWTANYGLLVNPSKTLVMFVGSRYHLARLRNGPLPPVIFNGVTLPYCDSVKNLGLHIQNNLSWELHVSEISRKIYASMHGLKRLQNFLPYSTKVTLVNSLLLPIIDYADVCYPDLTEELLDKLDRLLNLCIRYIFGLRKYDHVTDFRNKLKWLNIRHRRNAHIVSLVYGIVYNPCAPSYLTDRFSFFDFTDRPQRSSRNLLFRTPEHNAAGYSDSFTVSAVRLWNQLPLHIRQSQSIETFKSKVRLHYLQKQNNQQQI
ncbi:hypothetical protein JYU34_002162 [Plutella xylostella]|uniref:Reverse transcriptase domain-containing protein n=1 Tax=Plutella xylostella TaxID=51655 RepID=A0ABQ7R1K0_PLUXY|nr:hypothetical protein JYU34_002162 [Plutella xylostella]